MKKTVKLTIIICTLVAVCMLTACNSYNEFKDTFISGNDDEDTIVIGVFEPQSGVQSKEASYEIRGIELASELYPTACGKKIKLVYEDNYSDPVAAGDAIDSLIAKEPAIILGSYGNVNSMAACAAIDEAEIPAIAITCTNRLLTSQAEYYSRVCYTDEYQCKAIAQYTHAELVGKVATLTDVTNDQYVTLESRFSEEYAALNDDEYAAAKAAAEEKAAKAREKARKSKKKGKKVNIETPAIEVSHQDVLPIEFEGELNTYAKQLRQAKKAGIDNIFLVADTNTAVNIILEAEKLEMSFTFIGTDEWDTRTMESALKGKLSRCKIICSTTFSGEYIPEEGNEEVKTFEEAYAKAYKDEEITEPVALGYDAYLLAVNALEKAGEGADGAAVLKALRSIKNFEGATGTLTFDSQGNPAKSVTIYRVQEEGTAAIATVKPGGKIVKIENSQKEE